VLENNVTTYRDDDYDYDVVQVLEQEKYQLRRQLEVAEEEYQLRLAFRHSSYGDSRK
jgi:hypothetical protein